MSRPLIVLNRQAGRCRGRTVAALESLAAAEGARLRETTSYDEGREIAALSVGRGTPLVVAAGGDGTVQSIVQGFFESRVGAAALPTLAIVPLGRGNDLALALGCRSDPASVGRLARGGAEVPLDVGLVGLDGGRERVFVNSVGIGIEADVAALAHRIPLPGILAYALAALARLLVGARSSGITGTIDEAPVDRRTVMVSVGNGPTTGGGFRLTPHGAPGSGSLAWCAMEPAGRLSLLTLLPRALRGAHVTDPRVSLGSASRIDLGLDPPLPVHADGELLSAGASRIRIRVEPAALRVRLPSHVSPGTA
jgi:diacylglycerol kinase family enzyme